jgi:hypothetical protein
MSTKFVQFTNAGTKEPILINADRVRVAQQVPGHHTVKLTMDADHEEHVEGDLQSVRAKLME